MFLLDTEAHMDVHTHIWFTNTYTHSLTNASTKRLNWQTYTCPYWQAFIIHPPATHTDTHTCTLQCDFSPLQGICPVLTLLCVLLPLIPHLLETWLRIKAALQQLLVALEMTSLKLKYFFKIVIHLRRTSDTETPLFLIMLCYLIVLTLKNTAQRS